MPLILTDVKAVVEFMRTQGVSSFKLDDMEVTFSARVASRPELPSTDAPLEHGRTLTELEQIEIDTRRMLGLP
jgi:hypothetical protein